jgi:hypothetical protein
MSTETSKRRQQSANGQPAADEDVDRLPQPDPEADPLTKDEMFHLLSNRRRRDALRYLADRDEPVDMRDLAEQVAAWEHDTTVAQLDSDERQRVYIALYQTHLPKLDSHGVIAYNQSRGIVERTDRADQLDPYLREGEPTTDDDVRSRTSYGLGVCTLGLAVLAVGWLGLLPAFSRLVVTWIVLSFVAFTGLDRGIAR